ncbi:zinc ribbon domain-containing protein [Fibrobacterota bacterium]
MPIYEYECHQCGNRFEELVSIHNQQPLPCPECKSGDTEKLMSLIGGIRMGKVSDSAGTPCAESSAQGQACPAAAPGCGESGSCPMS